MNWGVRFKTNIYFTQRETCSTLSYAGIRTIRLFKHYLPRPCTNSKKYKGLSTMFKGQVDCKKTKDFFRKK